MAFAPDKPRKRPKLALPPTDVAMNKVAPLTLKPDDKGATLGDPTGMSDGKATGDVKQLTKEQEQEILGRIRKRMEACIKKESGNRKAALEDRKFKAGDQWPADVAAQRNTDKRPCLTINQMPTFVNQVTNDQRQNRPAINYSPIGDKGDKEAAKMFKGLTRAIERDCAADIAYDTAFDDAVTSGFGYWRYLTEYEAPDSFDQVISIHRVRNPFTVYLDPFHQQPDGSDIRFAFVTELIPRDDFEDEYPDSQPMPFMDGAQGESFKDWIGKDVVRIAEYFEIEYKTRTLVKLENGFEGWEDELSQGVKAQIKLKPDYVLEKREADVPKVMWYKCSGVEILEHSEWLGQWIPIVKVIGNEIDIEGDVKLSGLIRMAKDPQRMLNYWERVDLNCQIPTPYGWKLMRDIHEGDQVFGEDGRPWSVVGESPVFIGKPCFKITFDDGETITTDDSHPWQVLERRPRKAAGLVWETVKRTTSELDPKKHVIVSTKPLQLADAELPVDPYVLGVWLGDGDTCGGGITQGRADVEEMRSHIADLGYPVSAAQEYANKAPRFTIYGLTRQLRAAGTFGRKHIPADYLRASENQRWALLQGLMDTDGSTTKQRQCSFTTVLPDLASGFAELLRSLGIKAVSCVREAKMKQYAGGHASMTSEAYQFSFCPGEGDPIFRLSRKASRLKGKYHDARTKRHRIVSVEPVPSVPVKCIAVDNPSHLFLAGRNMVPTHNTSATELIALAPKAPWIVAEGQIEGYERYWKNANFISRPFLEYKPVSLSGKPVPPPSRQPFAGIPGGVQQALENQRQHMMAVTGIRFDATNQERMNDESGVAVRELRRTSDLGSLHYVDNLSRSLRHGGRILVDLIPKIYDEKRRVTILHADDSEELIEINPHQDVAFKEMPGEHPMAPKKKSFNPKIGKYGVAVTIGPSFATKRIEAAESMMQFAKAMPQVGGMIADLIAKNMDWEGADEMSARLAKALPPQLLTPDQKDVPPQIQALLQNQQHQMQQMGQQLQAMAKELQDKDKDREVAREKINLDFDAKILKVLAETERTQQDALAEQAKRFTEILTAHLSAAGRSSGAEPGGSTQASA